MGVQGWFLSFVSAAVIFGVALLAVPHKASAALLNASAVLGQGGVFTTRTVNYPSGSVNARGFKGLNSMTLDLVHHRLFTSEAFSSAGGTFNDRIMVFQLDSNNNIATDTPSYVLGACDFTTAGTGAVASSTFGSGNVVNLYYDSANDRLFVSAYAQSRVLGFDVAPADIQNCEPASFVIGQVDFTHNVATTTQSGINGPDNITFDPDNSRLFISEFGSNRVVAFSVPPGATSSIDGENALFVLGQPDFISHSAGSTRTSMSGPTGLYYDNANQRLFVSDFSNNRVTAYSVARNATSSIDGENALFVLGQPDFTTVTGGASQTKMNGADDMSYDPATNRMFVGDVNNNRVMVFIIPPNADSSFNGAAAQNNINESDWTSVTSGLAQNKYLQPDTGQHNFDPVNNILYDYELYGNRAVEFQMIHITNASLAAGHIGAAYSQAITTEHTQGTSTTFKLYSGTLPDGLTLNASTGVISGTPTTPTTTSLSIEADDNFSTGPFFDVKTFSMNVSDVTAPTVSFTSPTGTVTGVATLLASSTDDVGVAGVQFYVDSTPIGSQVTTTSGPAAYSTTWDSSGVTDGTHMLYAVAEDTSGNFATSSLQVKIFNHPGGGGLIFGSGPLAPGYVNTNPTALATSVVPLAVAAATASTASTTMASAADTTAPTSASAEPGSTGGVPALILEENYQLWDSGADILHLQQWLNSNGFVLAGAGAGSPGDETDVFGPRTYRALIQFQAAHGLPATGFLGPLTRALLSSL